MTSFTPTAAVVTNWNACVMLVSNMLLDDGVKVDADDCRFSLAVVVTYHPLAEYTEQFLFIVLAQVLMMFICIPTFMPTVYGFNTFAIINLTVPGQVQQSWFNSSGTISLAGRGGFAVESP